MRIIVTALFAVVCVCVVGCGEDKKPEPAKPSTTAAGAATGAKTAAPAAAPKASATGGGW